MIGVLGVPLGSDVIKEGAEVCDVSMACDVSKGWRPEAGGRGGGCVSSDSGRLN